MGRSTGTVFVIALVLGTVAFVVTLMLAPMPEAPAPRQMTDAEREAEQARQEQRAAIRRAVRPYEAPNGRSEAISTGDWDRLYALAHDVVEVMPGYLWAHLDLLHAMEMGAGIPAHRQERIDDLGAVLGGMSERANQAAWQRLAASAWYEWYSGDEARARALWKMAADEVVSTRSSPIRLYNQAGYLSLSGDVEGGMQAWEQAIEQGYQPGSVNGPDPYAYARNDYDNRELIKDPRFEAAIAARTELLAQRALIQARQQRDEIELEHMLAHPPARAGGSHAMPASP